MFNKIIKILKCHPETEITAYSQQDNSAGINMKAYPVL